MPKTRYGDNIITAVEDTKVDLDPNINYSRIYKNNIQVDLGISTKGKAGVKIKKVF
jgi:ribosomal protein L28